MQVIEPLFYILLLLKRNGLVVKILLLEIYMGSKPPFHKNIP